MNTEKIITIVHIIYAEALIVILCATISHVRCNLTKVIGFCLGNRSDLFEPHHSDNQYQPVLKSCGIVSMKINHLIRLSSSLNRKQDMTFLYAHYHSSCSSI